jgi:SAM-dependent methyltransferase
MGGHDPDTLDFYQREATAYAATSLDGIDHHLAGFLARLKPGCTILELGSGSGRDAAQMMARGFHVVPTDGAPAMAAEAAARLGTAVRTLRFEDLDDVAAYDAVIATAALLHVPRPALPDILKRIARALKPGGWHVASFKSGLAEGRDSIGRYYNYPDRETLERWYDAAGPWDVMDFETFEGGGYDGTRSPWLAITVRKSV